jgi:hypothetical protein
MKVQLIYKVPRKGENRNIWEQPNNNSIQYK